jgi:NACHT domain.
VDGFPDIFAEGNRKNLIVDTAGMGKSTLAKRIFVDLVEKKQYYPLLLELRRLSGDKGIIGGIEAMLELPQYGMGVGELEKLFSVGNFVFIFDGFDEVPREERGKTLEGNRRLCSRSWK